MTLQSAMWLIAVVLFVIGAIWNPGPRWNIMSAGLTFLTLGFLIPLM